MTLGVHGMSRPYFAVECQGCRGTGQAHQIPCMEEAPKGLEKRAGRTSQGCPCAEKNVRGGACESTGRGTRLCERWSRETQRLGSVLVYNRLSHVARRTGDHC